MAGSANSTASTTPPTVYPKTAAGLTKHPKLAANLLISDLIGLLPPEIDEITIPIKPEHLASVAEMAGNGVINSSVAKKLMHQLVKQDDDPVLLVKQQGLEQISDPAVLTKLVNEAIAADTKSSAAYRSGNAKAFMALMGRVMGKTAGKGNPVLIKQLLEEALNSSDF